jgi:Mce-associated membrane protein
VPPHTRKRPRANPSAVDAAMVRRLAARRAHRADGADETGASAPDAAPDAAAPDAAPDAAAPDAAAPDAAAPDGAAPDAVERDAAEEDGERQDALGGAGRRPLSFGIVLLILAVATLVFGGLAAWFGTEAGSLTGTPSAQNDALSDPARTSQVISQVTSAIDALFSYDYAAPVPTTQAAGRLLTGAAVRQYASLFGQVQQQAPKQKLIVTTTVTNAGVELLTGDTARVLVFAVETDQKASGGTPSSAGAMLAVNVVRDGGTWKIEGIDTFGG